MGLKKIEGFDSSFWEANVPVQFWRDEDSCEVTFVGYMPRKEECFNSDPLNENEIDDFIDNSIEVLKRGIELMESFKKKEIDKVYY